MSSKRYQITATYHRLPDRTPLVLYSPSELTERAHIAILAMHFGDYHAFPPMVEMAKRGFFSAGANPVSWGSRPWSWIQNYASAVRFLKALPGIEKVILMGHSEGGCRMSCYQYLAENGASRFTNSDRIVPFPDAQSLPAADGLMLLDANYGIMSVLALDPAVEDWKSGYSRNPELDLYNPENGYSKDASHYTEDFIRRFQKAQIKMYRDILHYALERKTVIDQGKGAFADDEPLLIAGSGGGSNNNKLFIQDPRLLSATKEAYPLLHADGTYTTEQIHTVRLPADSVHSEFYRRGAWTTTIMDVLQTELRFSDDFGYDASSMWGIDEDFNPLSTRANVKGIHIPLLIQGNTASHEFVNAEMTFACAASSDKTIFFSEGSQHDYTPLKKAEAFPGQFGDPLQTTADAFEHWLIRSGRFM